MSNLPREVGRMLRQQPICPRCLCRMGKPKKPSVRWTSTAAPSVSIPSARSPATQDYFFANDAFITYAQGGLRVLGNGFWSPNSLRRAGWTAGVHGSAAPKLSRSPRARLLQTSSSSDMLSRAATTLSSQQSHTAFTPTSTTPTPVPNSTLRAATAGEAESRAGSGVLEGTESAHTIPPDASARLSVRARQLPPSSLRRRAALFLALSKPRLTFLMVLTTASAYSLYPEPELLSATATSTPSLSALTLVFLTSGTTLCSASANALNMWMEPAHDAKMSRTRNRPLVRGLLTGRAAVAFAIVTGASGTALLYFGVNPTVAFLGAANIALYAGVYTPLKRASVLNTWAGAVVGAIPPLMGWAAAAGQSAAADGGWRELLLGEQNAGGWLLASLLFAWQFPHFNALSWTIREEYKAAGYRMMAWVNERRNARVALRYALLFFPICAGLAYVGVTDRGYLVTSSVVNLWIAREAYRFWKFQGHKGTARALFWAGVWQLPCLMVLAMLHKKGLWDGVWNWAVGEEQEIEEEESIAEAVAV